MYTFSVYSNMSKPSWNGKRWVYNGKTYRSLRLLRTQTLIKQMKYVEDKLAEEMRNTIDNHILSMLGAFM